MFATVFFALTMVASDDPVGGDLLYTAVVGEKAVLHHYDQELGTVDPQIEVWTNPTSLSRFIETIQSEAYQRERTKVLGNPKELKAVFRRQREALLKELVKREEVLSLPDMTPVRVRALATFYKLNTAVMGRYLPDFVLVEVLDGTAKGRFLWVSNLAVGVPVATLPKLDGNKFAADPPEGKPAATPHPPAAKLLIESSTDNRLGDYIQVHCRLQNISGKALDGVTATVVYEDAAGNLVHSGNIIVGDLQPGETKTVMTLDKHEARMDHYNFEFEGRDDTGKRHGLGFTTAGAKRSAGRR
jgi:hypothetical protein